MKNSSEQSLRGQIEKWLAPSPSIPLHVTRFSRAQRNGKRYVCVETSLPAGTRALFFFRHPDGCWCVFPPVADTPRLHFIPVVPPTSAETSAGPALALHG